MREKKITHSGCRSPGLEAMFPQMGTRWTLGLTARWVGRPCDLPVGRSLPQPMIHQPGQCQWRLHGE